jgi:hypothetical protein
MDDTAGAYRGFVMLIYCAAYIYALVTSVKRFRTLMWMVLSLVTALLLVILVGYAMELITKNGASGMFVAEMFTVPSFIVPAVVGIVHSRRTHRGTV